MEPNSLKQARFLHKTIKRLQNRMLKQHGAFTLEGSGSSTELTATQLSTLIAVRDHQEMTLKEIAEATHVSPPSASTMVDKLVEAGALTREHSKIDRREVRVSISPRGLNAVEKLEKHVLESLTDLLEGIGSEYAEAWCDVYERIEKYIDKVENPKDRNVNCVSSNEALGAK